MKNRNRIACGLIVLIAIMAFAMVGCGTKVEPITVDGVSYVLGADWNYDEEYRIFTNANLEDVVYVVQDLEYCDMKSLEERRATFADDNSDGIDKTDIEVAGEKALLTHEPVNEIDDYNIYFYIDGQEHIINFETDYGNTGCDPYTQELIESIQK